MSSNHSQYPFSIDNGGKHVGAIISGDLRVRVKRLCNILEMPQSSLLRFFINRGVEQLEAKLVKNAQELRKAEEAIAKVAGN